MNVNLTEVLEADTAVRLLQNKKDKRQVVWVLAVDNNWTETSLLEKATIRDPKKPLFWANRIYFKMLCFKAVKQNSPTIGKKKEAITG